MYAIQGYHFTKMITTSWIKITVTEVYDTINNGGSFKFWGKFHEKDGEMLQIIKDNTCEASSQYSEGWGCTYGLKGELVDQH